MVNVSSFLDPEIVWFCEFKTEFFAGVQKTLEKRSGKFNDLFGNLATKTYVFGLSCQAWEEKLSFGIMLII